MNKGLFRNKAFGSFEIGFSNIYKRKDHALEHQWIALQDPDVDKENFIVAYLKVSFCICGPHDHIKELSDDTSSNSENTNVLMQTSIKREFI